ncbi:MAG: S-layer homology domain-containing protein [Clostridia bacterium]|nr:S-layer homology domain-containing protein [Clostridia bacterium]
MLNKLFKRILFLATFTLLFSMMIGMTVFATESYTILNGDSTTEDVLLVGNSKKEVTPTTYTVSFDLNGGSENEEYPLEPLIVASGSNFTLPKRPDYPAIVLIESGDYYITVDPPEGKWIDAFEISGERHEPEEEITINSDTVIKCLWKDITYIDRVELNIEAPIVGTKIEGELREGMKYYDVDTISIRPVITIPNGVDYNFRSGATYWAESGDFNPYVGEIEAGKTYEAFTLLYCEDDSHQFIEEGLKVIINGEEATAYNSVFFVSFNYPMEAIEKNGLLKVDEWVKEEMTKAEEKGLIPETFSSIDATRAITRTEFAAVAVKLYEAISGVKATPAQSNPFTDTSDENILKAYELGITKGTSEITFTPDDEITREQMATMLTRALTKAGINTEYDITNTTRFADDNDLSDWGRPSVYFMASSNIIKGVGDNKFNGLGNAKVEEAIAIALRSVDAFAK